MRETVAINKLLPVPAAKIWNDLYQLTSLLTFQILPILNVLLVQQFWLDTLKY